MKIKNGLQQEPVLPGLKPVLELLQENSDKIVKIIHKRNLKFRELQLLHNLAKKNGIRMEEAKSEVLDLLCGNVSVSHQGVIAILSRANTLAISGLLSLAVKSPLPLVIALDQIQDQGNLGAITRTAYALGCTGLILPRHDCASPGPGAYRASAGALEKLPFSIVPNLGKALDLAEEMGFTIYGSISQKDCPAAINLENIWELSWQFPAILALGNENRGLRPGILKRCSQFVTIPFAREFDSLNIAQAAAIIISQAVRFIFISKTIIGRE